MNRAERIFVFFGMLIIALLVSLIVILTSSDDSGPVAGDSSSTEAATTAVTGGPTATDAPVASDASGTSVAPFESDAPEVTDAPEATEAPVEPGAPVESDEPVAPTADPPTPEEEAEFRLDLVEFSWESEISIDASYPSRNSPQLTFKWDDATGEDSYGYRFRWTDDAGAEVVDEIGDLPQDTDRHTIDVPCGVAFGFELAAWSVSDGELGRLSIFSGVWPCESPPSNLRGSSDGSSVRFEWDPATGHDRYLYQMTTWVGGVEASYTEWDIGPEEQTLAVEAGCGTVVDFTLITIAARDGAEIDRLTESFETIPCPIPFP